MTPTEIPLAQRRLGLRPDGRWSPEVQVRVRRFQLAHGLLVTGDLDEPTLLLLAELAYRDPPCWEPSDGWAKVIPSQTIGE